VYPSAGQAILTYSNLHHALSSSFQRLSVRFRYELLRLAVAMFHSKLFLPVKSVRIVRFAADWRGERIALTLREHVRLLQCGTDKCSMDSLWLFAAWLVLVARSGQSRELTFLKCGKGRCAFGTARRHAKRC
jgi:hypothetical protein